MIKGMPREEGKREERREYASDAFFCRRQTPRIMKSENRHNFIYSYEKKMEKEKGEDITEAERGSGKRKGVSPFLPPPKRRYKEVCEVAEDVEAVVRELERLEREQARIQAILQKYQKMEEERKALLKKVEGEINEAKEKAKKIGIDIDSVLDEINTVITTDDKLTMPALSADDYEALLGLEKVQMAGAAGEFIKRIVAFAKRELAKRKILAEVSKVREGGVVNFPPADTVFKVFNEVVSVVLEKGEEATADDVENAVKKITRRATAAAGASRARRGGGRRTRKTGVANYIWEELQKRGEISLEEGAELLVEAGFYDDLGSAKNGFNSAQYTICRWTDPQTGAPLAEYEDGVLRLL